MAKLLGKGPNQVPTNADLGTMAFQDREGINVNNAIVANLVVTGATSVNTNFAVTNATSNVLFVAANGNVGVQTSTPASPFQVYANAAYFGAFNTTGSTTVIVDSPTAQTAAINFRQGGGNAVDIGTRKSNTSVITLRESASGIERITFVANSTAGAIGINNTAPADSLSVYGTFAVTNATSNTFYVAANGNVGVGTSTSNYKLYVLGSPYFDTNAVYVSSTAANTTALVQFYTANTGSFEINRFVHPGGNTAFDAGYDTGAQRYYVNRFDNNGAFVDRPFYIDRTSGNVVFSTQSTQITGGGGLQINSTNQTRAISVYGNATSTETGLQLKANSISPAVALTVTAAGMVTLKDDSDASPRLEMDMAANVFNFVGGNVSFTNSVSISGNLTVSGTTTYINTTNLNVGDNIITLNADLGAVTPTENAGFEVNRGTSTNTSFYWDETNKRWTADVGNSSNSMFVLLSNSYVRTIFTDVNSGLFERWGTPAAPSSLGEFVIAAGVTKFDSKNRDYLIANGSVNTAVFAANGNFGIGNTAPIVQLQVTTSATAAAGATIARFGTASASDRIRIIDENSTGGLPPMITSPSAAYGLGLAADQGSGPIVFYLGGTANTTNEKARFAANGNFGIGTNNPAQKLVVVGTANISSSLSLGGNTTFTGNTITYNGSNTSIAMRVLPDGVLSFEGGAGQLFSIANSLTGQLFSVNDITGIPSIEVYSNGQVNMARFGGNVAIGSNTTTTTFTGNTVVANTLYIGANVAANATAIFLGNSTVNTVITQTTASFNANSTYTTIAVASNGNVGIGDASPTSRLQVNGNFRSVLSGQGDYTINHSGLVSTAGAVAGVQLALQGGGVEAIRISTGANVGIGNTAPNARLQVTGTANVSGNVAFGQDLTVAGNLTVSGTTTYINTSQLNIGDNVISLNADFVSGTPTENAGMEVIRGGSPTVQFMWNESRGKWGSYTTATGQNAAIEAYGNTATLNITGYGNSTSNTSFSLTSDASVAWAKFDTSTSTITDDVTAYIEMKTGGYRASGIFHTNEVAPRGGANAFFFAGYNYTGTGWQVGWGTAPTNASNAALFISRANGNIGIANSTPTEKLVVNGNILANNLRRYTATRTLTTALNDTVEIGTLYAEAGAHSLDITIQVTDSGFSVTKRYLINSPWNATNGVTYRKVVPAFDSGPFSSNDYDLEAYHTNQTLGLRVRRTGGSTTGLLEIMIDDLVLQSESANDYFTPSSTTASGVAAVTDLFPGSRLLQTGVSAAVANAFVVVANTTVNAITSNSTVVAINLPVSFGQYTSLGFTSFVNLGLTTSATTANQVLSQYGAGVYRAAKFFVQITSGSAYQATEITLIHDGTNVYKSEYGTVYSGAVLATFDADINSGNVRLLTTPVNAVTVYKGIQTQILV